MSQKYIKSFYLTLHTGRSSKTECCITNSTPTSSRNILQASVFLLQCTKKWSTDSTSSSDKVTDAAKYFPYLLQTVHWANSLMCCCQAKDSNFERSFAFHIYPHRLQMPSSTFITNGNRKVSVWTFRYFLPAIVKHRIIVLGFQDLEKVVAALFMKPPMHV